MKKILLAIESVVISDDIQDRLQPLFDIVVCHTGEETLDTIYWYRPDVLVLDLMVGNVDSVSILRAVRQTRPNCRILVVGNYFGDYVVDIMEKYSVNHAMRWPGNGGALAAVISDLAHWEMQTADTTREIRNLLAMLGFKINTESYRITELAVLQYRKDPGRNLTAGLYPSVAALADTTPTAVEKSIRFAVESAWKHCDKNIWKLYFGLSTSGKPVKPGNKEFLSRVTEALREKEARKIG